MTCTLRNLVYLCFLLVCVAPHTYAQFAKKGGKKARKADISESFFSNPATVINMKELSDFEAVNPPAKKPPRNMEEDEEEKEHIKKPKVPKLDPAAKMAMPNWGFPSTNIYSPIPATTIQGLNDGGSVIPPDIGGAVGPNHLIETLNDRIRIFTKTGTTLTTVTLDAFWAGTGGQANPSMFDPKVLYDPYNDRYIMTCPGDAQGNNSAIFMAVTQTNDPTGTWYKYRFDVDNTNTNWFDYPSIGFNNKWIVVTGNMFSNSNNSFANAKIFVFNKANLYAGTGTLVNTFTTTTGFTICPAITYDNTASLNMYMVATATANSGGNGAVRLYTISGAVGSPAFAAGSYVYSPAWSDAGPNAPQQGTNNRISTNDDRMQNVVYRNGSLWCAHTVFLTANYPNHSAIQWWQINPTTATAQQIGRVNDSTGTAYYAFPSIAVNMNNDVLIGFTQFSPNMYASSAYAYRSNTDPLNTIQVPYVYKMGEATYYKTFGGTNNRWGDYSSTCVDSDDMTLWTIQEYAESPANTWGTYWAKVSTPAASCSGTVTLNACPGAFDDGSSSSDYANNSNCSWLIQPLNATSITLNFTQFNVLSGDTVKVYNGNSAAAPLLGAYTGSTLPASITGTATTMFVKFTSNASGTASGWAATYTCSVSNPGGQLSCNGLTTLTTCSGTVTDGSGSNNYDDFVNCSWLIAPSPAASSITLTFTAFDTESGYDSVKVYNGTSAAAPLLGGYSGTTIPPTLTANSGKIFITFQSDAGVNATGWSANYSCTPCSTPSTPTVTANPSLTICAGQSTTLTASSSGCTGCTYSWSNGTTGTTLTTSTAGTYTVTVTNGCGATATSANKTVVVNPLPTSAASNTGAYCAGSTIQLNSTGGGTYAWAGPNSFTSTAQNPTIANSTTAMAGTYTVTVTQNGCTNTATTNVVVNASPTAAASNTGAYCAGSTIQLNSTGGGTYAWAGPNSFTSTAQNPTIANSTTAMAGTYTVTVTQNGCTKTATTNVVVNALPNASASNTGAYCLGGTIQLNSSGGGTYAWSGPNLFSSTTQNPTISNAALAMAGTYTVTVTQNGCTKTATTNVVVNSLPNAAASNTGAYCSGSTIQLNATPTTGMTYSWAGPNGFSATTVSPSIANSTTAMAGVYSVTVTSSTTTCAKTVTTNVVVNATPSVSVANVSACENGTATLQPTPANAGTYSWSGPNGFSSASAAPSLSNITTAMAGVYSVTVTSNGCSNNTTTNLTVNPAPTITAIPVNQLCEGQTLTLAGNASLNTNNCIWTGPNAYTCSTTTTCVIPIITPSQSGTYTVVAYSANNCPSTSSSISVLVNPKPVINIVANNTTLCEGDSLSLCLTNVGAGSVQWNYNNNAISNQLCYNKGNIALTQGGVYSVIFTNASGCADTATSTITVNPSPTVTVGNNSPICAGQTLNFTATGGGTYAWSGPNGFSSASATPSIINTTVNNSGTYSVIVTGANTCKKTQTTVVNILAKPEAIASSNSPVCVGGNLQLTGSGGATLNWSQIGTSNTYTGSPVNVTATTAMAGVYQLIAELSNGCTDTTTTNVVVNPLPIANAGNNVNISFGGSTTLNATGGGTYSWIPPTGLSNPSIANPVASPTATTTYTVYVTSSDGCIAADSVIISVAPIGIDNEFGYQTFTIYPNPTQKELNIVADGLENGKYVFNLVNELGQIVKSTEIQVTNKNIHSLISLENLASGNYNLQIISDKGAILKKVIKE